MKKTSLFVALALTLCSLQSFAQDLKGDPWIFKAYQELYFRKPNAWELNIYNYNQGSWNNYEELKTYITRFQSSLASNGISISTLVFNKSQTVALFNKGGKSIAVDLISNDGGSIVAQGGGNLVAQGGGNLVAQGGGNIQDLQGVGFQNVYKLLSGQKVIASSGKSALVLTR